MRWGVLLLVGGALGLFGAAIVLMDGPGASGRALQVKARTTEVDVAGEPKPLPDPNRLWIDQGVNRETAPTSTRSPAAADLSSHAPPARSTFDEGQKLTQVNEEQPDTITIRLFAPDGRPLREAMEPHEHFALTSQLVILPWVDPLVDRGDGELPPRRLWRPLSSAISNDGRRAGWMTFRLRGPRKPQYLVVGFQGKAVAQAFAAMTDEEVSMTIDPIPLLMDTARLQARFVDPSGEPLGAMIHLTWFSEPGGRRRGSTGFQAARDGRIDKLGLEPLTYELQASSLGLSDLMMNIELLPGETLDLGTLALPPRSAIEGRLLGELRDIANRTVAAVPEGESVLRAQAVTNENGYFRIGALPPSNYAVHLVDDHDERTETYERMLLGLVAKKLAPSEEPRRRVTDFVTVSTLTGDVSGVQLELREPAEIALRAVFLPGEPIDCTLTDPAGHVVATAAVFAVDGREHLWVVPGAYELSYSRGSELLGRRRVVTGSETVWVELFEEE